MHCKHRRDSAELIDYPQLAHVPGVQDEIDAVQGIENDRWKFRQSFGGVRVADEADAGHGAQL